MNTDEFRRWGIDVRQWTGETPGEYERRVRAADNWMRDQGWQGVLRGRPEHWRAWWSSLPPTAASRELGRKALNAYGHYLVATRRRATNPAVDIPVWRQRPGVPRPLPAGECARLVNLVCVTADFTHVGVALLLFTGLRVGEASRLRWTNWDGGNWLYVTGKGGKERQVPCADSLRRLLRRWRDLCGSDVWVLPGMHGPTTPDTLRRHCRKLIGVNPHSLRHSAGTALMAATGNLALVQDFLGHASPLTTRVYTKSQPQRMLDAVNRLYREDEAA